MGPNSSSKAHRSLSEVHGSVTVPYQQGLVRRILAVSGPAFLVSVGYMDPGNWATDLAAGSQFNHALLWVLLMSNLMAVLLQGLCARLGVVRGLDLAQACRIEYPRPVALALYVLAEIAIAATDLAEVLGSAIALNLLFGLPLLWGVCLTAGDAILLLFLGHLGIRKIEAVILSLITIIAGALLLQIVLAQPDWVGVASGFVPSIPDSTALYVAIGMLGATVMPHNLYLHSALVQSRQIDDDPAIKRRLIRLNTVDSAVALNVAFFVNASILVLAASVFYRSGHTEVAEIQDAHRLLEPILGAAVAPVAFAVALLASGQSSTITGTLAGQIVMEGFLNIRIPPWMRRLITRLIAIIPAVVTIVWIGDRGTGPLLVLSQVILSLQLPFAVIPLVHLVSDRARMGTFAIGPILKALAWTTAAVVVGLNVKLASDVFGEWVRETGSAWVLAGALAVAALVGGLLFYVTLKPWLPVFLRPRRPAPAVGVHAPAEASGVALEAEALARPFRTVAVALDFSGREPEILRETLRILGAQRPRIALMHVVESAPARFLGRDWPDAETPADAERLEAYARELRALGFEVTTHLGHGRPVPELIRLMREVDPDLAVLGAHGHRFLLDLFFGSTADRLRHHLRITVLVVGPRD